MFWKPNVGEALVLTSVYRVLSRSCAGFSLFCGDCTCLCLCLCLKLTLLQRQLFPSVVMTLPQSGLNRAAGPIRVLSLTQ